jgi:DNA mismatch repair protein MutL
VSKIKILPEIVSNKIAAGEVVERPASVVKELVENAIDASSSKIFIEVEKGGKSLIRVSDNGTGMNKDDALLSIERYATSKIYNDQDLYAIRTLGFRGEALPSIASVSRFSLITKNSNSVAGTEIVVQGGKITKVSDAGTPTGTMITIAQLFYNVPARRKFLKTIATEMGHISDIVSGIALGRPDIRFKLTSDSKTIKDWSVATESVDRIVDVLGGDVKNGLLPLKYEDDILSVTGWVAAPQFTRSTSRGIYIYVNGRHVRDRVINHALFEGYGQRLSKGKFPLAALFITVPFDQVDVNVHPAKHEVRFARQKDVHDILRQAVSSAFDKSEKTINRDRTEVAVGEKKSRVSEPIRQYKYKKSTQEVNNYFLEKEDKEIVAHQPVIQSNLWETKYFEGLRVIGQLHNTYILCESEAGLVLIDQHAAHERVLFEQMKRKSKDQEAGVQQLLIPETIEVGFREAQILEKLIPDLKQTGVDIEHFGKNTFVVKSVPVRLSGREIRPVILEIVEKLADIGFTPGIQDTIDTCLVLMACHGAIRANQSLSEEEMNGLIEQLDHCDQPFNCPHGRPTWVSWSSGFLEKSFGRTG